MAFTLLVQSGGINEVRSQKFLTTFRRYRTEVVFETEIYAPLQKLCALKGGVLDPTIFDNPPVTKSSKPY